MFRSISKISSKIVQSRGFATYKTTTTLTGLKVDPNGRENLIAASEDILNQVKKIPETSGYRISVEQWFKYIHKVATENTEILAIEEAIDLGQIEEVLEMAASEKYLIDYYYENKVWELVAEAQVTADEVMADMADSLFFHDPEQKAKYMPQQPAASS